MAYPTLTVEIAFDDSPYEESPTWTPITEFVSEVSIRRGRSDDWSDDFVSTANVTLINDDRRFDPFNVSGIYFNKLRPRKQIRIRGTINGNTHTIFRGFVNGFPVTWKNMGSDTKVTKVVVDCFDSLALLSTSVLRGDLAEIYTKSLTPRHYYRCSDPSGTLTLPDLGSANYPVSFNSAFGKVPASYVNLGLGLSGTSMNAPFGAYGSSLATVTSTTGDVSVSMWTAATGQPTRQLFSIQGSGTDYIQANVGSSFGSGGSYIQLIYGNFITASFRESKTNGFDSSIPHHLIFTYEKSTGIGKIYIDGVDQTSTASGANQTGVNLFPNVSVGFGNGAYQEVAVFDRLLTATERENLYKFGQGNQSEATNTRLSRLLALTDLPVGLYSVNATAYGVIAGVPTPNQPVIDALFQAQRTEGGYLFVNRSGVLVGKDRLFFQSLTSSATFDDDNTDFGYMGDVEMWYDGDNLRNEVILRYGGNASQQASGLFDVSSIIDNGRHTLSLDVQSSNADEAQELAQHWLRYGLQNPPSISPLEVGLPATSAQWETLLQMELLDRVTFKRTPPVGSAFRRDLLINSLEYSLTPKKWSMTISGSSRFTITVTSRTATGSGTGSSSTSFDIDPKPKIRNVQTTAYNSSSATFYGEVLPGEDTTSVWFEYSTDSSFNTGVTTVTATPSSISGGASWTSVSRSITGLSSGVTYYFRVKATNAIGTTYGSGGGFTTYVLKIVTFTSSGTWTAPTWGGTPETACFYVQLVGGGGAGGGYFGGGGGGAGQYAQEVVTLSSSMSATIGANGGTTTLTNAGGNALGGFDGINGSIFGTPDGGASRAGFAGGTGFFSVFTGESAGGGGGGQGGAGGNYFFVSGQLRGGVGGTYATMTYWGIAYGGGGGGASAYGNGTHGGGDYGRGGNGDGTGSTAGFARFLYYAPAGTRSGTGWSEVNY
jgi:hypothetical protein